jgi:hypothetical protein
MTDADLRLHLRICAEARLRGGTHTNTGQGGPRAGEAALLWLSVSLAAAALKSCGEGYGKL